MILHLCGCMLLVFLSVLINPVNLFCLQRTSPQPTEFEWCCGRDLRYSGGTPLDVIKCGMGVRTKGLHISSRVCQQ